MSEREQDALLDKIESRRWWRIIKSGGIAIFLCAIAAAIGTALVLAR